MTLPAATRASSIWKRETLWNLSEKWQVGVKAKSSVATNGDGSPVPSSEHSPQQLPPHHYAMTHSHPPLFLPLLSLPLFSLFLSIDRQMYYVIYVILQQHCFFFINNIIIYIILANKCKEAYIIIILGQQSLQQRNIKCSDKNENTQSNEQNLYK